MKENTVKYQDVLDAQAQQNHIIRKTPLVRSSAFSRILDAEIYFKSEFLQRTGSFKIRGAYFKIQSLSVKKKNKGVITASAGNHGQGVALAASLEKIRCTVIMPKSASPAKISATREYGATVILEGSNYEESWMYAKKLAGKTQATIIHAYDDSSIIAGQGVVGLEILEQLDDIDEIYVPVGGGGLLAGVLVAIKTKRPDIKIIGVQSKSHPSMKKSLDVKSHKKIPGKRTIADGIAVSNPGIQTFNIIKKLVDKIVLVGEEDMIKAMFLLMERSKIIVEPAGVVGVAYLLKNRPRSKKKIVVILSGGNIDMYLLGQIVDKGLATMGRLMKISVLLPDEAGALKKLVDEITSLNANIVEVVHDRLSFDVYAGSVGVTLSLEMEGKEQSGKLIQHLKNKNIKFKMMT